MNTFQLDYQFYNFNIKKKINIFFFVFLKYYMLPNSLDVAAALNTYVNIYFCVTKS